jgi:hypothetical protein
MMSIPEVVEHMLRQCAFWAPELRAEKVARYLTTYGEPLAEALRALPAEDREALGLGGGTP